MLLIADRTVDKGGYFVANAAIRPGALSERADRALGAALGLPGTAEVMADMANYTTITPVTQTSEIVA